MPTHLKSYLSYYAGLSEPGYAVLVTGDWGSGKTHQLKREIPSDDRIYVSLFGLQSAAEIHAEVFAAAMPATARAEGIVKKMGELGGSVGGVFALAGAIPNIFQALIKRDLKPEKTLIFDDLERCSIEFRDLLGVINTYVEHFGFRVIVIAHDEKLTQEFSVTKEKLFGQTLRVRPEKEEALTSFVGAVKDTKIRAFLERERARILEIFLASQVESLRVLKHLIEDIGRLYSSLEAPYFESFEALSELLSVFAALDIEVRANRLQRVDLLRRSGSSSGFSFRAVAKKDDPPPKPPLVVANERYPFLDLESSILSDSVLVAMLCDGHFDPKQINECLARTRYFASPAQIEPWRLVMSFDELEDDVVEAAWQQMQRDFESRSLVEPGEILHICAFRMMMAERGHIEGTVDGVAEECKQYVSDLLLAKKLPPRGTHWHWYDAFDRSYGGYGYWVTPETQSHFKELWDFLLDAQVAAFDSIAPAIAAEMVSLLSTDADKLFEMISSTNNGANPYAHVPLLHHICPKDFVEAWMNAPKANWRMINYALDNRYRSGALSNDLEDEKDWALAVYHELEARAGATSGFASMRISRAIPKSLKEFVASVA